MVGLDQRGAPDRVGTPRAAGYVPSFMGEVPGSREWANSSATTAASAGSVVTPREPRAWSGLVRYPYGA
jgi:hypothetical protein